MNGHWNFTLYESRILQKFFAARSTRVEMTDEMGPGQAFYRYFLRFRAHAEAKTHKSQRIRRRMKQRIWEYPEKLS